MDPPCLLTKGGLCTKCADKYILTSGACVVNVSLCTSAAPCYYCPLTYYLSSYSCLSCPTSNTCLSCDATNTSNCLQCIKGYYLDQSYACQACPTGCLICSSSTYCQRASSGYYLEYLFGSPSGNFLNCSSICSTCYSDASQCTSCPSGFTLKNSNCQSNSYVIFNIVINPLGAWSNWGTLSLSGKRYFFGLKFYVFWRGFLGIFGFQSKPHRMRLRSCQFGSIIISSEASTESGQSSSDLANQLS